MQTKKQIMRKIRSMMKQTRAEILKEAEHLVAVGGLPLEEAGDDFRLPKAVLTAAMIRASWQCSPLSWDKFGESCVKQLMQSLAAAISAKIVGMGATAVDVSAVEGHGTDEKCPSSPTGKHEPDWNGCTVEHDGGDTYIDVPCVHCGRSGCVGNIETLETGVLW